MYGIERICVPWSHMHDRLRKKVIAEEPLTECARAQKEVWLVSGNSVSH